MMMMMMIVITRAQLVAEMATPCNVAQIKFSLTTAGTSF